MSREALVSVIICIYGGERFLRQTLESALAQTYRHWEIIAVDDGSPDRSVDIVRQFGDSRIRLLRQANAGAASALGAGIGAANGEYVALLDQDDLWDRESLGHHVRCLDSQSEIDLTFSWFRVVDDQGRDFGMHSPRYRGTADFDTLLQDFVIAASSNVVARRAASFKPVRRICPSPVSTTSTSACGLRCSVPAMSWPSLANLCPIVGIPTRSLAICLPCRLSGRVCL